ncbi:hypothetical protein OB03_04950 [Brevundimonas sp. GN22]
MRFLIITAAALSLFATTSNAQDAARLTLNIETGETTGTVNIAVFNNEQSYEGNAPVRVLRMDVAKGEHQAVIDGLSAGEYGIKVFHDVNDNGRMDTNPFGMPVEPYGFSNNAVGNMGPAKWDRARFDVSGDTAHTINLR